MTAIRSVRAAEGKFVQISNAALQDERLSWRARGILAFVLSLPPDHTLTAKWLETQAPDGREAVRGALRELAECGYYRRDRRKGPRGIWVWDQVLSDAPIAASEVTCSDDASPQVGTTYGNPSAGKPSVGIPSDKNLKTEPLNTKDQKMASRRARSSAASAIWTDEDKISGVRSAVTAVYGDAENEWISDSECLELYAMKAPRNGRVASPEAYMTKIFSDTPDLGTHLAGLSADLETDGNGPDTDTRPWACPRCGGTSAAPTDRGVCVWCDAELDENRSEGWAQTVLDSVKRGLREAAGYVADDEWAARVAAHILDGQNATDPARYVYGAITKDSNPKRFTPTPTPARAA